MKTDEIRTQLNEFDIQRERLVEAINQKNENPDSFDAKEIVATLFKELSTLKEQIINNVELLIV